MQTLISIPGVQLAWPVYGAEENTRAAIYDAFRRKETFGTSGTRMKVRFFAGNDLPELEDEDLIGKAYGGGVPMGGDLIANAAEIPSFIAWVAKDPNSASLQRLQIIKGWVEDGEAQEQVFDVACSDGGSIDSYEPSLCRQRGPSESFGLQY